MACGAGAFGLRLSVERARTELVRGAPRPGIEVSAPFSAGRSGAGWPADRRATSRCRSRAGDRTHAGWKLAERDVGPAAVSPRARTGCLPTCSARTASQPEFADRLAGSMPWARVRVGRRDHHPPAAQLLPDQVRQQEAGQVVHLHRQLVTVDSGVLRARASPALLTSTCHLAQPLAATGRPRRCTSSSAAEVGVVATAGAARPPAATCSTASREPLLVRPTSTTPGAARREGLCARRGPMPELAPGDDE
jgi:hypothetical protein